MNGYTFIEGDGPLLISVPHGGTWVPAEITDRFTDKALKLPDTDWFVPQLYAFAEELGASLLIAKASRYVVDLNRSPNNETLYPGQQGTGLCPNTLFDGSPIYQEGRGLGDKEQEQRVKTYWQPYHTKLADELARLKRRHGGALLYDAHSILPVLPRLFEGRLPDLNLGTDNGNSCSRSIEGQLVRQLQTQNLFTSVVNGRFVGGYITRHYGSPQESIHAVQMELAQSTYMNIDAGTFDDDKAAQLTPVLKTFIASFLTCL